MFIYVLRKKAVPWSFWYMALSLPKSYLFLFFPTFPYVLSHVWLFATPWTVACQAPLSMGFSRQEYWNRLPFPYTITLFWSQMDIWYRVNRLKCQTFWNCNAFSNFCARLRNSFNTNLFFFFFFFFYPFLSLNRVSTELKRNPMHQTIQGTKRRLVPNDLYRHIIK